LRNEISRNEKEFNKLESRKITYDAKGFQKDDIKKARPETGRACKIFFNSFLETVR